MSKEEKVFWLEQWLIEQRRINEDDTPQYEINMQMYGLLTNDVQPHAWMIKAPELGITYVEHEERLVKVTVTKALSEGTEIEVTPLYAHPLGESLK